MASSDLIRRHGAGLYFQKSLLKLNFFTVSGPGGMFMAVTVAVTVATNNTEKHFEWGPIRGNVV
jgi:hypothetical protein